LSDDARTETRAPVAVAAPAPNQEEMPRVVFTRRRILLSVFFVASAIAFLYLVLPKIVGLKGTWNRIQHGDVWWLGIAAVLEVGVFASYIALFRSVFARGESRIGWRESRQINLAALAATRLFAAAGAGGIALTAWALRRSGMDSRTVAHRMIAFLVLLYGVYMSTLLLDGLGIYVGLLPGQAPFGLTIIPAAFGGAVIVIFLAISLLPGDFERLVGRWTKGGRRLSRFASRLATAPATAATGVRTALALIRTRDPWLLTAITYWGCDIAVLWASFHAFGAAPEVPVVVMCYFVGMFGNTLPLPGGIGGVDGGMIGAFIAFGVHSGVAIVAVLAYRAFAFWLPTLPGAIAYLQLRRTVHRWRSPPSEAPSYT
jgi:uncharacterized protein (TIRG00374 family)